MAKWKDAAAGTPERGAYASVRRMFLDMLVRFKASLSLTSGEEVQNWLVHRVLPNARCISVYGTDAALVASLLDPRYKNGLGAFLSQIQVKRAEVLLVERIVGAMERAQQEKAKAAVTVPSTGRDEQLPQLPSARGSRAQPAADKSISEDLDEMFATFAADEGFLPDSPSISAPAAPVLLTHEHMKGIAQTQIECYRALKGLSHTNSGEDVLRWWRDMSLDSKVTLVEVYKQARIYASMQASSAASERVFSDSSNTITSRRHALGSDIACSLIFLNGSIDLVAHKDANGNPKLIDTVVGKTVGAIGRKRAKAALVVID
jgi:hypothetical protein